MLSTRSTDESNAAVEEKVEEFKLASIEQMKLSCGKFSKVK